MNVRNPGQRRPQGSADRKRSGFLSAELVLTLPILAVLLMALLQFSLLFYARSLVVEASRAGARKASLPGATLADVDYEIRRILNPRLQQQMKVQANLGDQTGDLVTVAVSVPYASAAPNLLSVIGISTAGQRLYSETHMARE